MSFATFRPRMLILGKLVKRESYECSHDLRRTLYGKKKDYQLQDTLTLEYTSQVFFDNL